jgi:hypothetical protein
VKAATPTTDEIYIRRRTVKKLLNILKGRKRTVLRVSAMDDRVIIVEMHESIGELSNEAE